MVNSLSHSRNISDTAILYQLNQHLQQLTPDQKVSLAIAALYTVSKPKDVSVTINCDCSKFINAIELLLQLSVSGKLAVTRAIAEELAVLEQLLEVKR